MPRVPRKLIALFALACALAAPTVARADHGEPYTNSDLEAYFEIASAHWDVPAPSCTGPGGEQIPVHAVLYDNPDPDVVASAEQPGCRMWLDRDFWPAPPSRFACTIIAHEWGHLLGHGHHPDDRNLMFEQPLTGAPGCSLYVPRIAVGTAVAQSSRGRRRRARGVNLRRGASSRRGRMLRARRTARLGPPSPRVRRLEHRVVRR
jgi:hypothetical protein